MWVLRCGMRPYSAEPCLTCRRQLPIAPHHPRSLNTLAAILFGLGIGKFKASGKGDIDAKDCTGMFGFEWALMMMLPCGFITLFFPMRAP